jgi:hypothetical protein
LVVAAGAGVEDSFEPLLSDFDSPDLDSVDLPSPD